MKISDIIDSPKNFIGELLKVEEGYVYVSTPSRYDVYYKQENFHNYANKRITVSVEEIFPEDCSVEIRKPEWNERDEDLGISSNFIPKVIVFGDNLKFVTLKIEDYTSYNLQSRTRTKRVYLSPYNIENIENCYKFSILLQVYRCVCDTSCFDQRENSTWELVFPTEELKKFFNITSEHTDEAAERGLDQYGYCDSSQHIKILSNTHKLLSLPIPKQFRTREKKIVLKSWKDKWGVVCEDILYKKESSKYLPEKYFYNKEEFPQLLETPGVKLPTDAIAAFFVKEVSNEHFFYLNLGGEPEYGSREEDYRYKAVNKFYAIVPVD